MAPTKRDSADWLLSEVLTTPSGSEDEFEEARKCAVDRFREELAVAEEPDRGDADPTHTRAQTRSWTRILLLSASSLALVAVAGLLTRNGLRSSPVPENTGVNFERYVYGPADQVAREYQTPISVVASRIDSGLAGRPMASGEVFHPGVPVAASNIFPLGSILELRYGESILEVAVRDSASTDLVLSEGAVAKLGLPAEVGRFPVWVTFLDYEGKRPRAAGPP